MSSAYAAELPPACVGCAQDEAKASAKKMLMEAIPISVWTDKTEYNHNEIITVIGQVANIASGYPVTVTVVSPLNSIVTVNQITVAEDKSFETTLNTAGAMWKYDGTYTIKVNYGSVEKSNSAKVELIGGVVKTPTTMPSKCGVNEITADGQCIPFTISGGVVKSATLNTNDKSIVINIDAKNDGTLTVTPSKKVQDGIFMVLVDGEQWDDVEIDGNKVTVMFLAGAEKIEIIGTFVIPEFGTIAAMILAVAIISIIAVSAKSRLSIMPRY
ncbi:PEFG-CTERM sorting domain-containing protein [Nitrosopumilus ureiphilus]|uniref:PEFG-CTERM domain-containing protein n=1 Tax=Nitrosopumilus ureiphilus TaxID=1470067 RepID=A0A7D5R289_9ARCH|nr:PEFG-CTERM sorting domain-containing protein [Nitrosopumilus ureiphilus]QLH06060.1 PEFG-CTERM domain-containing protein [Nitrosopumilus ureiphilus]